MQGRENELASSGFLISDRTVFRWKMRRSLSLSPSLSFSSSSRVESRISSEPEEPLSISAGDTENWLELVSMRHARIRETTPRYKLALVVREEYRERVANACDGV